ncbi:DNA-methyltransferase [Leptolyngbya sp. NIES-2104]|uniref:DNA-methyltransferase n=1 Tax=Leptolyngbya sp. NIES-2104 TaxID=1552121 RepID=UPI0006ECCD1A|nr:site-specific DNA-methyltransferase [Leptolyngbya sp. NIES-2104]GAP93757.1 putative methyltransferase [Leptolyngbya sp. NIES-2104]
MTNIKKGKAPRNRSLELTELDRQRLRPKLISLSRVISYSPTGTIQADSLSIASLLPDRFVDLLILDPPYNLSKNFNGLKFERRSVEAYSEWLETAIAAFKPLLKPTASIYICGDWLSSASIFAVASNHFIVRNRITWEREKGRGAKANWKNSSEDIWFCTVSNEYTFNLDAVKLRRRVLAPYRTIDQFPKDWEATDQGNFRDTHPSNFWTDITIPFWSMPENTEHPTQKSEKLIAKLILASSNPGDFVLDPFVGSGTTSVVAKKLDRHYLGIDLNEEYCLLTERRLELAEVDRKIQGWSDGVFWERNTLAAQQKTQPF